MEINELQHLDFIWTWKSSSRSKKVSLWLPYFRLVKRRPKGESDRYTFYFNGGEVTCHLKEIDFLLFYGATGELPIEFLDKLNNYNIPLMIHRRNKTNPYVFYPTKSRQDLDVLSQQILARKNLIKRCYIARTLILARLKKMIPTIQIPQTRIMQLKRARTLKNIRSIEALITKKYWRSYFDVLKIGSISRRDSSEPINAALDAGSFFIYGIILRWVLFHNLSPNHGFLHEPTGYSSLCYDLMEPYRYLIEEAVHESMIDCSDTKNLTAISIGRLKEKLDETVYVPATRQRVANKTLLHGAVLALRSYLLAQSKRFILPEAGERKGGRPPKIGYLMPGRRT